MATGIKSQRSNDIVKGYDELYKELLLSGIIPVLQQINNEIIRDLIEFIQAKKSLIR